jgi:hypothetical protein
MSIRIARKRLASWRWTRAMTRDLLALELGDLASPCGIQHLLAARKIGRNSQNRSMMKVMTASR